MKLHLMFDKAINLQFQFVRRSKLTADFGDLRYFQNLFF